MLTIPKTSEVKKTIKSNRSIKTVKTQLPKEQFTCNLWGLKLDFINPGLKTFLLLLIVLAFMTGLIWALRTDILKIAGIRFVGLTAYNSLVGVIQKYTRVRSP